MSATRQKGQYSTPRYYEIAFDMNRKREVDFLVHCFSRYSRRPVSRVLDIACGTGPHLLRLARRGYRMTGLDLSAENIAHLGQKASSRGLGINVIVADMNFEVIENGAVRRYRQRYLSRMVFPQELRALVELPGGNT